MQGRQEKWVRLGPRLAKAAQGDGYAERGDALGIVGTVQSPGVPFFPCVTQ